MLQEAVAAKSANIDPHNQAKLQRGAKLFMNYCSGCHSLRHLRYSTLAKDLGLTDFTGQIDRDLLQSNLIFTSAKIEDPIAISMPATDAREWFGIVPPDLTLSARERGGEWIYRYLKAFYADSSRPFGANNSLTPETAMPNVLYPLWQQGQKNALYQHQYERDLEDLVSFLVYVAEPAQLVRYRMGFAVIIFLCVLSALAYLLKKSYWQGV
ncbi:cytochrome c1 [Legionella massiliensis]|uniref:cytochrome c1 n=1 Tax=Legionella massiliensis TaxID=1034943 RepID=UPI003CCC133C